MTTDIVTPVEAWPAFMMRDCVDWTIENEQTALARFKEISEPREFEFFQQYKCLWIFRPGTDKGM